MFVFVNDENFFIYVLEVAYNPTFTLGYKLNSENYDILRTIFDFTICSIDTFSHFGDCTYLVENAD